MTNQLIITSVEELFLCLDDINEYVNSIILYHYGHKDIDLREILSYLSWVDKTTESIKKFIFEKLG